MRERKRHVLALAKQLEGAPRDDLEKAEFDHRLSGALQHYYSLFQDDMDEEEKDALWAKILALTDGVH